MKKLVILFILFTSNVFGQTIYPPQQKYNFSKNSTINFRYLVSKFNVDIDRDQSNSEQFLIDNSQFKFAWHWTDIKAVDPLFNNNYSPFYDEYESYMYDNQNPDPYWQNQAKQSNTITKDKVNNNAYLYLRSNGAADVSARAVSIEYKANLLINPDNVSKIQTGTENVPMNSKSGDPSRSIFGFTVRNNNGLTINEDNLNYLLSIEPKNPDDNFTNALSGNFPNNELRLGVPIDLGLLENDELLRQGNKIYVAIKLKRKNAISPNPPTSKPVLRIKVKSDFLNQSEHLFFNSNDKYFIFDQKPSGSYIMITKNQRKSTEPLNSDPLFTNSLERGNRINCNTYSGDDSKEIIITDNMLPPNGDFVTIYASFGIGDGSKFNGQYRGALHNSEILSMWLIKNDHQNNDPLDDEYANFNQGLSYKTNLQIEVDYKNTANNTIVDLDFIRLENESGRNLFWGEYDPEIYKAGQIFARVAARDKIMTNSGDEDWIRYLKRLYLHDEGATHYLKSYKYMFDFIGDICHVERGTDFANEANYYLGNRDSWTITGGFETYIAAPFYKTAQYWGLVSDDEMFTRMRIERGYQHGVGDQSKDSEILNGVLNDSYELASANKINIENFSKFASTSSSLTYLERKLDLLGTCSMFYNPMNNGHLYNRQNNWIGQVNFDQQFTFPSFNSKDYLVVGPQLPARVLTGEEISSFLSYNLIFGAKGLSADGVESGSFVNVTNANRIESRVRLFNYQGLQPNDESYVKNLTNYNDKINFLLEERFGGDFMPTIISEIDPILGPIEIIKGEDKLNWSSVLTQWGSQGQSNSANALGVAQDRIYIGQKSMRLGLFKMFNYAKKNEETLMDLEFCAAYGKGYLTYNTEDPKLPKNPNTSHNFIDFFIDKSQIKTRPLVWNTETKNAKGRKYPDGSDFWENDKPSEDSGFYDVTLLRSKAEGNFSHVFYISVFNKRANPLFFNPQANLEDSKSITFRTYAEWFKMYNQLKPTNTKTDFTTDLKQWDLDSLKRYWWSRLGCREIKVKFNYNNQNENTLSGFPSNNPNNLYKLLKISEIDGEYYNTIESGGNPVKTPIDPIDLPLYLQSDFVDKIDTTIGQDGSLLAKLLPGEAKIFKVEVLDPGMIANGKLDNSNQTKLVCFPIYENGIPTEQVQYHSVYYKVDANGLGANENQVFYSVSEPINRNSQVANIKWRYPIKVSNYLNIDEFGLNTKFTNSSLNKPYKADFPSIIVRRNSDNTKTLTYITFQSYYIESNIFGYINEAIYDVSNLPILKQNYILSKFKYENEPLNSVGNPVINSSPSGNFVAWSDKGLTDLGFVIRYLYRDANELKFLNPISSIDNLMTQSHPSSKKLHPSLNSYTSLTNEAILVWEQKEASEGNLNKIYMTNLKPGTGGAEFFLPNMLPGYFKQGVDLKYSKNIAKINWGGAYGEYPVVNLVENGSLVENKKIITLSWQRNWFNYEYDVFSMQIWSDNYILNGFYIMTHTTIRSVNSNGNAIGPIMPNLSNSSGLLNVDSRAVNFDCISENSIYSTIYGSTLPWNIQFLTPQIKYLPDANIFSRIEDGNFNHLAQINQNFVSTETTRWKNRRIFEYNNYIQSDAKKFYKINGSDKSMEFYLNYSNPFRNYGISNPKVNGNIIGLDLKGQRIDSSLSAVKLISNDSLFSDWFQVGLDANLNFNAIGNYKKGILNDTLIYLQKQSDMTIIPIAIDQNIQENFAIDVNYSLINGLDSLYRIVLIRRDSTFALNEMKIIGNLPISDTINYKKSESNIKIIDLASKTSHTFDNESILIYPNPTNGIVNISPAFMEDNKLQNTNVIITISNITGAAIYTTKARNGSQISFDTSKLSTGSYIVTCETEHDDFKQARTLTSKFTVTK